MKKSSFLKYFFYAQLRDIKTKEAKSHNEAVHYLVGEIGK
jgi:hypothetical protein